MVEAASDEAGEARRRSPRIPVQVPVDVDFGGTIVAGRSAVVNRHGALILCSLNCAENDSLELTNKKTNEQVGCRVVWCSSEIVDGERKLGVELSQDSPAFWGIDFSALGDATFKG
jgi:hypothetical protein